MACAFGAGSAPSLAESSDDSGTGLQAIVVTALKRQERLQDTAATVDVVTSQEAVERGITDIRGLASLVPSIKLSAENTATQVFIRGIGQSSDGDSNSPAVAVNFDGVYTPRYAIGMSMFDLAQVEILPGPQGLLYGQNAAGGAININSRLPGSRFEANGIVEGGNYGLVHASAGVDLPVSDTLNLRAAIDELRHDGYLSNGQNDAEAISGRVTAVWRPNDALSVLVRGEVAHSGGNGAAIVAHPLIDPNHPWYDPTAPGDHFYSHENVDKFNAEINYRLDRFTITYIPSFIHYAFGYRTPLSVPALAPALLPLAAAPYGGLLSNGQPAGYFAAALVVPRDAQNQVTNELRFTSNNTGERAANTLSWLAGLYQLSGRVDIEPGDGIEVYNKAAASGGSILPYAAVTWGGANYERHNNQSYAAFGQLSYALTDWLSVSGGPRYSLDQLHADGVSQTYLPATPLFVIPFSGGALVNYHGTTATLPVAYDEKQVDHHVDWRVGIEAAVAPDSLVYGSVQTGYNQGGFNLAELSTPQVQFKPETLLAFTVGSKNTFLDQRLVLNDEVFYYDYDNLQVASFDATKGSGFRVNIPKSVIYGDQLDVSYRLSADTILTADIAWLNAHIVRGTLGPAVVYGGTAQYPTCGAPISAALCTGGEIDYSGYSLANAPPVSASATLRHFWHFTGGADLEGLVGTHFDAATWGLYAHVPGTRLPAYTVTDLILTYHFAGDGWSVAAWVKNLENSARPEAMATDSIYGQAPSALQPPRTYGVRVGFKFGG
jgi:iron complex outermembrane receptor protein